MAKKNRLRVIGTKTRERLEALGTNPTGKTHSKGGRTNKKFARSSRDAAHIAVSAQHAERGMEFIQGRLTKEEREELLAKGVIDTKP